MEIKSNMRGQILSGLLGGGLFVIFFILLGPSLLNGLISLGIGTVGYIGGTLIFASKKPYDLEYKGVKGITEEYVITTINNGRKKIFTIREYGNRIGKQNVMKKIDGIIVSGNKIFNHFERDPKNLKTSEKYIFYVLDTTIKVLENYYNISSQKLSNQELQQTLKRAEESLETIREALEKQLVKILQDNVISLDSELSALEETINMEDYL